MNMLKCLKFICCLIKCSKVLYFVKKILCALIIMLSLGAVLMSCCDKKKIKKLVSKCKAVM